MNHPRRTPDESMQLTNAGWFPFPELNEADNDVIFQARLAGFALCFPVTTATEQAHKTLKAAQEFLDTMTPTKSP